METEVRGAEHTSSGGRQRYEEKTVRTVRGRERSAIAKAEAEGWTVVRQDSGKLQTTIELRKARESTTLEKLLDRMPLLGGMADSHRPPVFIGAAMVVLVLVLAGVAIFAPNDDEGGAPIASETAADPAPEAEAEGPSDTEPGSAEPTSAAPTSSAPESDEPSAAPVEYSGPAYEVVEIDSNAVLGEQDLLWVYTEELDPESPTFRDDAKAIIEDVAREKGTPNLSVSIVMDREIIAAESANTGMEFTEEKGADYVYDVVLPKAATEWVVSYSGGLDLDQGVLSTEDTAYTLDWWPAAEADSESWKPELNGRT